MRLYIPFAFSEKRGVQFEKVLTMKILYAILAVLIQIIQLLKEVM